MTEPEAACQCTRWASQCTGVITAEDLLCDTCRGGCAQATVGLAGGPVLFTVHTRPPELEFFRD